MKIYDYKKKKTNTEVSAGKKAKFMILKPKKINCHGNFPLYIKE